MRISDWSSDGGSSDLAGAIAGWTIDDFRKHWTEKRGAVGRVHANIAARVVDPATGAALPAGEEGLLELKGEQLGNGLRWLRTPDRAVLDADHFLFIRGRAYDAIIRGGFQVHPAVVVQIGRASCCERVCPYVYNSVV